MFVDVSMCKRLAFVDDGIKPFPWISLAKLTYQGKVIQPIKMRAPSCRHQQANKKHIGLMRLSECVV